jgi:DNA repair protein RecO (recombination protein O)
MTRPRNYQTEAVIIKKTRLGEADSILTMYTPDMGKIQGFAKSLRRPRSKMAGHLELLTHSKVSLARGRNLDTITGSQTISGFLPLKNDLWLASYGLYVIELVNQFTAEHDNNPSLFQLLLDTLHNLCREEIDKESVLCYFELHLLGEVGYRPQLQRCVVCKSPLQPVTNYFSPAAGGVLCPDCGMQQSLSQPLSVNALKALRFLQENNYETANRLKIDRELSSELQTVMRSHIKYLLERDVKSVDWLNTLRMQTRETDAGQQVEP